jgi:hypothetical protein
MVMRVALLALSLLASCGTPVELPNQAPDGCPDAYIAACNAVADACFKSPRCTLRMDFEPHTDCLPGCMTRRRRCYAECPVLPKVIPPVRRMSPGAT